jgi:hypothetical protein
MHANTDDSRCVLASHDCEKAWERQRQGQLLTGATRKRLARVDSVR